MYGVPGIPLISSGGEGMSFPMDQPKNLFRYGEQTIWSSQFYGAAAIANNTQRVFTTPLGQVGQGFSNALSIAETNLKEGGRIPSGVAYDVFGISCHMLQGSGTEANNGTLSVPVAALNPVANLQNLLNNCVLTWDFTQTQVDVAPAHLVGTGGGVFGSEAVASVAGGAAFDTGNMNNGNGSLWLYRKHPVALPGNSTFAMLLRWGSRAPDVVGNPIVIRITLLGYYKNVIEIG